MIIDNLVFVEEHLINLKEIPVSSQVLLKDFFKKTILKRDSKLSPFKQAMVENAVYEKYGNLDGLPKKVFFWKYYPDTYFEAEPYALEKEYIEESPTMDLYDISEREKKKMIDLIHFFYDEEFYFLDLKEYNFIVSPEDKLYMVDFGALGYADDIDSNCFPDESFLMNYFNHKLSPKLRQRIIEYNVEKTKNNSLQKNPLLDF